MAEGDVGRERAALAEAADHDVARGNAARDLAVDERADLIRRFLHSRQVARFAARQVARSDVEPRGHHESLVERNRTLGRVREHEADRRVGVRHEVRHDRFEVVSVGTEAVEEDDGSRRLGGRFDFDGGEQRGGHHAPS